MNTGRELSTGPKVALVHLHECEKIDFGLKWGDQEQPGFAAKIGVLE